MSRDITHEIRLRQLRERDGADYHPGVVTPDPDAKDFTGSEIDRLRLDPERQEHALELQRLYHENLTAPAPRN